MWGVGKVIGVTNFEKMYIYYILVILCSRMFKTDFLWTICQSNPCGEGGNLVLMTPSHSIQIWILWGSSLFCKTRVGVNDSLILIWSDLVLTIQIYMFWLLCKTYFLLGLIERAGRKGTNDLNLEKLVYLQIQILLIICYKNALNTIV